MKITAIKYFEAFEKRDACAIREMFDVNVTLRDWEINALGIDSVMAATTRIFDSIESISVKIINVFQDEMCVIGELNITIDSVNQIKVVDIIEFNSFGKICAIRAFKG